MKIVLIAPTYLPARRANTIQVMKMAQALVQSGHTLEVLVPESETTGMDTERLSQHDWPALAQQYGLETQFPVQWLPTKPSWRSYDYGWNAYRRARSIRADLIYTRLPQAAAFSSLLGMPTLFEIHDYPQSTAAQNLFRLFLRGKGAQRLVVITQALAGDLKAAFGTQITEPFALVAPDGVDLRRYIALPSPAQARQELGLVEQFTVGYTGHLYPGRGIELILELGQQLPHINFLLAGGDPDTVHRWRGIVSQRRLSNLTFTGFIPNAEIPRYQAACELLLMPYQNQVAASSGGDISRYLSPMKLFEYLACGRTILASDLPVLREILNPENALLLPPEDLNAWAEAIQIGLQFPKRYSRLASQAQLDAQNYTWTARAKTILKNLPVENQTNRSQNHA